MKTLHFIRCCKGATLIESIVLIAILSLLLHFALFEFKPMLAKNRLDNRVHEIKRALHFARLKAQSSGSRVTFCALNNNRCEKKLWHKSLTVFVDRGKIGIFENGDTILLELEAINSLDMLTYTRNSVTFGPSGIPMALNNGTFLYCPEYKKESLKGLSITISPIGRARLIDTDKC
jgi:type IV fimbrial biogenesis protein FimT